MTKPQDTGIPIRARCFLRAASDDKLFGGFVSNPVAGAMGGELSAPDEVWEVEITFVRRLAEGRGAEGLRIDQVMTGPYLSNPETVGQRLA